MDTVVETLKVKFQEWQPATADQVRQLIAEIIELADQGGWELVLSRSRVEPMSGAVSFAELAHEFMGCLDSDLEDLSYNPDYMQGFGE